MEASRLVLDMDNFDTLVYILSFFWDTKTLSKTGLVLLLQPLGTKSCSTPGINAR